MIEDPSKHKNKKISNMETNKVYHKKLYSLFDNPRTIIDEGIFFYFKEPKSFTGESNWIYRNEKKKLFNNPPI